jgi:hypothetical protein
MAAIYRPLDSAGHEIRLLRLLPSEDFDSLLSCELDYGYLDNVSGSYEALTYFWGEPDRSQLISIDGQEAKITKNLETALRYLRLPTEQRTLWVDALCINQDDITERSHQVTLMMEIYSQCSRDLAWLGPLAHVTRYAYEETVLKVKTGMDMMRRMGLKDLQRMENEEDQLFTWENVEDGEGWVMSDNQHFAIRSLFRRPEIWNRVWVMQELSCAPNVTLVYGRETLDWAVISDFLGDQQYADAFHLPIGHGDYGPLTTVIANAQAIQHQRGIVRDIPNGYQSTLLDVLARFKAMEATDPRDNVYGLLGLVSEKHSIRVDYRKSEQEVFSDVTVYLINRHANLDIICQNPWRRDTLPPGPSWTAQFSGEHDFAEADWANGFSRLLFAQRSIYSAGREDCSVPVQVDGTRLCLRGAILGRLGPILASELPLERQGSRYSDLISVPREWMLLHFKKDLVEDVSEPYLGGDYSMFEAYWRTLAMDCKAYPIKRLTKEEIKSDGHLWFECLLDRETRRPDSMMMLRRNLGDWYFCLSDNGLFLMLRNGAMEGDYIAVLDGGKVPVLLREVQDGDDKKMILINVVYVQGFMDGEAVAQCQDGRLEEQEFWIS